MNLSSLPENHDLAFVGETAWPAAALSERDAAALLASANACGRPNADVLRRRLAVHDGAPVESWQIDFPAHFTTQEAALYERPFAKVQPRWQNPHLRPELRRALARVSRYLALPADAEILDWRWIEEDLLPDATLAVVARDDDFTHGVLQSNVFALWSAAFRPPVPRLRSAPNSSNRTIADAIGAFPFPWPPGTALSALSRAQEESRHAIARAARTGATDLIESAVRQAYGWTTALDDVEIVQRLMDLHARRRG